jgi:hypothetical protein
MKGFIRLKDLENVSSENVNIANLMHEAYGFKNKGIFKAFRFMKIWKQVNHDTNLVRATDVSKIAFKECCIAKPSHIEKITYSAMMELNGLLSREHNVPLSEVIADIISTACFSENIKEDFDTESKQYLYFKNRILNSPILEMFGLYNSIIEEVQKSSEDWEEKFFSVEIEDPDYEQAGGQRMAQFNVINTLKKICKDFNRNDKEAWQMPFYMVQHNSYESASKNFTQQQMTTLKEIKMRSERDRQSAQV